MWRIDMAPRTTRTIRLLLAGAATVAMLAAAGCSAEDPIVPGQSANPQSSASIPAQQVDPALRDRLPAEIRDKGSLVSVNSGSFPPYEIIQTDGSASGASADLLTALGQLWGVEIEHETVDGLPSILTGLSSNRYQLGFGPIGDFKERQAANDFVDYVVPELQRRGLFRREYEGTTLRQHLGLGDAQENLPADIRGEEELLVG